MKRLLTGLCLAMLSGAACAAADEPALKPFQQDDYRLAFDAFVASGDQERAYRLALKAVAAAPADIEWRRRLARLATWTRRPEPAWEQWEYLYRHGDRSEETLNALLALAPLAENPDVAIEAWESRAGSAQLTDAQWEEANRLFELTARPREGSRFFERHFRRTQQAKLLEYAAQLAEHGGEDERALQLYLERDRLQPVSVDATLHAVILLLRRDELREAYALMESHRAEVPQEAENFWRLLGHTAWQLMEFGTAELAYGNYTAKGQATEGEWSRLIALVSERHPERAAGLAQEAYRRYGDMEFLLMALSGYGQLGDLAAQQRMLDTLTPEQLRMAENSSRFLVLRAQYHQLRRESDMAWQDFRRALEFSPGDSTVAVPALWFAMDAERKTDLQALLRKLPAHVASDPAYWLPLAAAYHTLDRYREAVPWYRKEIARDPDNLLLLLNFADALERVRQEGMAERIRRHCWLALRNKFPEQELVPPLGRNQELLALARLVIYNQPGDPGLSLVRGLVSRLRELPAQQAADQPTTDLVLSWTITKEQYRNAASWLWLHYARRPGDAGADAPLWGASQAALQLKQSTTMANLLEQRGGAMPIHNRYDTARELGRRAQAFDIAFRGMEDNEADDTLHDRYRQHAPQRANYLQLKLSQGRFGPLDTGGQQFEARLVPHDSLRILLGWSRLRQGSNEAASVPPTASELLNNAEVHWTNQLGEMRAALFRRNEFDANTGFSLAQEWEPVKRLQLQVGISRRTEASDSIPLRVAGYQDEQHASLNYALGKREYLLVATGMARYYTQNGDYLGSGRNWGVEGGYRIRTEYPDWRVRAFAMQQSYGYDGGIGAATLSRLPQGMKNAMAVGGNDASHYFLPGGSTTSGVCLDMGDNLAGQSLQEGYSRAWRPFFSACKNLNTLNGSGYNSSIGIAGSLSGEDHVSLRMAKERGGPGAGATNSMLDFRYRHYF